jgi:hypothetical protein
MLADRTLRGDKLRPAALGRLDDRVSTGENGSRIGLNLGPRSLRGGDRPVNRNAATGGGCRE